MSRERRAGAARRRSVELAFVASVLAMASIVRRLPAQSALASVAPVADLPLREVPVSASGARLVLLITGDGGFAAGDRGMMAAFAAQGMPVVALNARGYLEKRRDPDEAARDAARIVRHYLAAWRRDSVVLVGYSRGADMAPFIVTRLPADLRSRLSLVAMIGLTDHANFEFHWSDLVKDTRRSTDYPVAPEVLRIHAIRMLCLYGEREKNSLCPTLPASVLLADRHAGKHALGENEGAAVAQRILRELRAEVERPGGRPSLPR